MRIWNNGGKAIFAPIVYLFFAGSMSYGQVVLSVGCQQTLYTLAAPPGLNLCLRSSNHEILVYGESKTLTSDYGFGGKYSFFLDSISVIRSMEIQPYLALKGGYYQKVLLGGGGTSNKGQFFHMHFSLGSQLRLWRGLSLRQEIGFGYSRVKAGIFQPKGEFGLFDQYTQIGLQCDLWSSVERTADGDRHKMKAYVSPGDPTWSITSRIGTPTNSLTSDSYKSLGVYSAVSVTNRISLVTGVDFYSEDTIFAKGNLGAVIGVQHRKVLYDKLAFITEVCIGAERRPYNGDNYSFFRAGWGNFLRLNPDGAVFFDMGGSLNFRAPERKFPGVVDSGRVLIQVGAGLNIMRRK